MDVISTVFPPEDGVVLMVFDTLVDQKELITALTVGGLYTDGARVSAVGQRCLERLSAAHKERHPTSTFSIVEIKRKIGAQSRVRKALEMAAHGDAVLFLCADDKVYDAAFPHLNVILSGGMSFDRQ